jgi:hypothetical protein
MRLEEFLLKEMPQRTQKELADVEDEEPMEPFFSTNEALQKRGYELVGHRGSTEVLITKDRETAIIGNRQKRGQDGAEGIMIYGQLIFKTKLKLGVDVKDVTDKVLQVDVVEVARQAKMEGLGTFLYSSLVQAGYSIITDTLHYEGGYKLWKKISRAHKANEVVYILDHGKLMLDDQGKPIEYDGENVPEDQIWSDDELKKFVLLLYTKKH